MSCLADRAWMACIDAVCEPTHLAYMSKTADSFGLYFMESNTSYATYGVLEDNFDSQFNLSFIHI